MEAINYIDYNERVRIAVHVDTDISEPEVDLPKGTIVVRNNYEQRYFTDYPEYPELTRDEIKQHTRAICSVMNKCSLLAIALDAPHYLSNYSSAVDAINESIADTYANNSWKECIDILNLVYDIRGYQIATGESHGYSQGDTIRYFIALPNLPSDPIGPTYAQGVQDEYAAWAFGDGYGYVIEELINDEWQETDCSCWGFYGDLSGSFPDYLRSEAISEAYHVDNEIIARGKLEYFNSLKDKLRALASKNNRLPIKRNKLVAL